MSSFVICFFNKYIQKTVAGVLRIWGRERKEGWGGGGLEALNHDFVERMNWVSFPPWYSSLTFFRFQRCSFLASVHVIITTFMNIQTGWAVACIPFLSPIALSFIVLDLWFLLTKGSMNCPSVLAPLKRALYPLPFFVEPRIISIVEFFRDSSSAILVNEL